MNMNRVSLVRCLNYDANEVFASIKESIDLLGGIENFVKPNEKVLIKPNLLTDAAPEQGIDTHPEIVRAIIRLLKPLTRNILCGDSPSVWGKKKDVDRVYEISGIKKVCQEEGANLVYFSDPIVKNGYPVADWVFKCDRLINVPKFKTHGFTVLTAGLKNLFGLIVGLHKMKIHRDNPKPVDLCKAIVDIYQIRKPDLNVLDGVVAMEGQGPGTSGNLKNFSLIAASVDALCMDMVLASIMGLKINDIPTNKEAISRGLGPKQLSSIEILGKSISDFESNDFKLPKTSALAKLPAWSLNIISILLSARPHVNSSMCRLCGLCLKSCPVGATCLENGRINIDRNKCILCLCCQEVCPHTAIDIKKGLIYSLISKS